MKTKAPQTKQLEVANLLKLATNNWPILLVVACFGVLLALIKVLDSEPQYLVSGIIKVDDSSIDSDLKANSIFSEANRRTDVAPKSAIQMVYITTPYILQPLVSELNLDIQVQPRFFPLIGKYLYTHYIESSPGDLRNPLFNSSRGYAWGGEKITVSNFIVPTNNLEWPYLLKVIDNVHFQLSFNKRLVLNGTLGEKDSNSDSSVSITVDNFHANPGTIFIITKRATDSLINSLAMQLQVAQLVSSKKDENYTGVVQISLISTDRFTAASIINSIMDSLVFNSQLENSTKYRNTLKFINAELPNVRKTLQDSENTLAKFKTANTITLLEFQQRYVLDQLTTINTDLANNKFTLNSFKNIYGPKHPLMLALLRQESEMQARRNGLFSELKKFPAQDTELIRLKSTVDLNQQLLSLMLTKQQELQILASGQTSDVRVLNSASIPLTQQKQNLRLFLVVGAIIGVMFAWFGVLLVWLLRKNANPYVLEEMRGINTVGIIKFVKLSKRTARSPYKLSELLVPATKENYATIHALHLIATEILLDKSGDQVFQFFGAGANVGTTLVVYNLAELLSKRGYKILIITMRRDAPQFRDPKPNCEMLNPNLMLCSLPWLDSALAINREIKHLIENSTEFNYVLIDMSNIYLDATHAVNLLFGNKRYMVISQEQAPAHLIKIHDLLLHHNLPITATIFNYNKCYWVHDIYSK